MKIQASVPNGLMPTCRLQTTTVGATITGRKSRTRKEEKKNKSRTDVSSLFIRFV